MLSWSVRLGMRRNPHQTGISFSFLVNAFESAGVKAHVPKIFRTLRTGPSNGCLIPVQVRNEGHVVHSWSVGLGCNATHVKLMDI